MFATDIDPLFSYSLIFRSWAGAAFFVVFLVLGVVFLIPPWYPILILIAFSGAAGCLFLIFQGYFAHVRVAEFWEDKFSVRGRRFNKQFSYTEIEDVSLLRGPWPNTLLSISLKGEEEALTLQKNPYSKLLDMDLYSWLKEKIDAAVQDLHP